MSYFHNSFSEYNLGRLNATGGWVVVLAIVVSSLSAGLESTLSVMRYIIYLVPLVFLYYSSEKKLIDPVGYRYVVLMGVVFIFSVFVSSFENYKYIVFMYWGFVPYAFILHTPPVLVRNLFFALATAQMILFSFNGLTFKFVDVYAMTEGSSALTHTLPGVFCVLFGYFFAARKWRYVALCFFMILIASKRSVLIGAIVGVFFVFIYEWFYSKKAERLSSIFLIMALLFGFTISALLPDIYYRIAEEVGINVNIMTSGRYEGQAYAYDSLFNPDISKVFFGEGLGVADYYAWIGFLGETTVIHNDYLRLVIDFGWLLGFVFSFLYLSLINKGRIGAFLIGMSVYMWLTENNIINIMITIVSYLCVSAYRSCDENKNNC